MDLEWIDATGGRKDRQQQISRRKISRRKISRRKTSKRKTSGRGWRSGGRSERD
jgi:hypothetical protein